MTTPEVEIVMPYGVTLEGDGARDAKIVGSHPQAAGDVYLNIPSGPCRIGFSWEGPEEMRCYVTNRGPGMIRFVGSLPAKSGGGAFSGCYGRRGRGRHGQTLFPNRHHSRSQRHLGSVSSRQPVLTKAVV